MTGPRYTVHHFEVMRDGVPIGIMQSAQDARLAAEALNRVDPGEITWCGECTRSPGELGALERCDVPACPFPRLRP